MRILKRIAATVSIALLAVWLSAYLSVKFEKHEYTEVSPENKIKAEEYLTGKLSAVPESWQWDTFFPEPNVGLRTGLIDADQAKGTIVMVPGFTGFAELSMRTALALNSAGYRLAFIEHRGQGKSWRPLRNPEKGHVESYAELANDLALYAESVRIKNKPLFFFATSQGAHITMRMAAENRILADAYALNVPMIKINTGDLSYDTVELLANLLSAVGLGDMYAPGQSQWPDQPLIFGKANDCNANPETAQLQSALFALDETLRTKDATVQWIAETVASTKMLLGAGYTDSITEPVKIFTVGNDLLVDAPVSHQFCDSLKQCHVTHFKEAQHCVENENWQIMDEIIEESIALFDSVTKAYPEK